MPLSFRVDLSRMTFGEFRRHSGGLVSALWAFGIVKTGLFVAKGPLVSFPTFEEQDTSQDGLSTRAQGALAPAIEAWRKLGYSNVAFQRIRETIDPDHLDSGAALQPSSERDKVAFNGYGRRRVPTGEVESSTSGVYTYLSSGRRIGVGNQRGFFDPVGRNESYYVATDSPEILLQQLEKRIAPLRDRDRPMTFPDWHAVARLFNETQDRELLERTRRGLLVPVADAPVVVAAEPSRS